MIEDEPRRALGGNAPGAVEIESLYLGRQPILDRRGALVAFELLFRSGVDNFAEVSDDACATAHVVARTLGEIGINAVLGDHRGYVNISRDLLLDDIVHVMAPDRFVLEILETVRFDAQLFERCTQLRRAGFTLALDDVTALSPSLREILPYIDILKVDFVLCERARLPELISVAKRHGKLLIAEKIETQADQKLALDLGFDMFQGYFFAYPQVLASRDTSSSSQALLRLLMLLSGDPSIAELESELKLNPKLVMQLVRLTNSWAFGLGRNISSLREAIIAVGTQKIGRWVQLLLYADGRKLPLRSDPLTQLAGTRARFMELAADYLRAADERFSQAAFMTGIFSLAHVVFGEELKDMADMLQLTGDIRAAIIERSGELGLLLTLAEAAERGTTDVVCRAYPELAPLPAPVIAELNLSAAAWFGKHAVG